MTNLEKNLNRWQARAEELDADILSLTNEHRRLIGALAEAKPDKRAEVKAAAVEAANDLQLTQAERAEVQRRLTAARLAIFDFEEAEAKRQLDAAAEQLRAGRVKLQALFDTRLRDMNVYRVGLSPEAIERTRQADEAISSQKAENALAELEARQARRVYDDAHEKAEAARLELTAV